MIEFTHVAEIGGRRVVLVGKGPITADILIERFGVTTPSRTRSARGIAAAPARNIVAQTSYDGPQRFHIARERYRVLLE